MIDLPHNNPRQICCKSDMYGVLYMILLVQELKCAISNIEDFTNDITRGGEK